MIKEALKQFNKEQEQGEEDSVMGRKEYVPSETEMAEAERLLTPEQAVARNARYEILKNRQILRGVGVTDKQIQQAAALAGKKAIEEYRYLEKQEPWNRTMNILEETKTKLSPDEQLLLEFHLRKVKDFLPRWEEKVKQTRSALGQDLPIEKVINYIGWNEGISVGRIRMFDHPAYKSFPAITLMDAKYKSEVNPRINYSESDDEVIKPTDEGARKIFKALGAEYPRRGLREIYTGKSEKDVILTHFPGVFLEVNMGWVNLLFSPETLSKMIEAREKLTQSGIEE